MTETREFYPDSPMTPEQKRVAIVMASVEKLRQAIGPDSMPDSRNIAQWFMPKTYSAPQEEIDTAKQESMSNNPDLDRAEISRIIAEQATSTSETRSIFKENL